MTSRLSSNLEKTGNHNLSSIHSFGREIERLFKSQCPKTTSLFLKLFQCFDANLHNSHFQTFFFLSLKVNDVKVEK